MCIAQIAINKINVLKSKCVTPTHYKIFLLFYQLGNAISYRKIYTFIKGHYDELREEFGIKWKKIPAYTTIRNIIRGLSASDLEECFRQYTLKLSGGMKENSFIPNLYINYTLAESDI